jgi:hypothetical protein
MTPADTTVVFNHGGGRFGNQLTLFGHLIALAEENPRINIINIPFWPYASLCRGTQHNRLCQYPSSSGLAAKRQAGWAWRTALRFCQTVSPAMPNRVRRSLSFRLPRLAHRWRPKLSIDRDYAPEPTWLGDPEFVQRLCSHRTALLAGYELRDWAAFQKHEDAIRRFLSPVDRYQEKARDFLEPLRRRHHPLIGVLLRKTDYRIWQNGRFFFDNEQYTSWLRQMKIRFGADTGFVLGGDEVEPADAFHGLDCYWASGAMGRGGHYLESMLELSGCDVVASVPSTFAAWAAFFGRKPLLPFTAPEQDASETPLLEDHLFGARQHPEFSKALC